MAVSMIRVSRPDHPGRRSNPPRLFLDRSLEKILHPGKTNISPEN